MAQIRDFNHRERPAVPRNVENAPQAIRQELVDRGLDGLLTMRYENLKLMGYQSHGKIAATIAV